MKILITGGSGFIGTNLVESCLSQGISFVNVDWNPPLNPAHNPYWKECDILDRAKLQEIFSSYQPTAVVHLAARTDTEIYDLEGDLKEYIQNTEGTQNVLECIKQTPSVERALITSTMFVCEPGYMPKHDQDYKPFTLYGKSKMLSEHYTRNAGLDCIWTIIRPQTIWGPWCVRYRDVMFKVMRKGLYFHPNKKDVCRSYGYIKNMIWQIEQILSAPKEIVHQQVYYVGDEPLNLLEWVQCISKELTGKPARIIPTPLIKGIALTGDVLKKFRVSFPITSTRFNSMTQDYLTPIDKTVQTFGKAPYSMEMGVQEIVNWYYSESDKIENYQLRKVKATVQ